MIIADEAQKNGGKKFFHVKSGEILYIAPFLGYNLTPILSDCLKYGMVRGRSSGVEHNLAKVRVEGSNPFARSIKEIF